MKNFLYTLFIIVFVQAMWGVNPKIAQPLEQSVIIKDRLFLFIEPTPEDVEERRYLLIEIYERQTGTIKAKQTLSPSQNYQTSINIEDWDNGKYLLKVIYVDKKGSHLTKSSWRNFSVEKQ